MPCHRAKDRRPFPPKSPFNPRLQRYDSQKNHTVSPAFRWHVRGSTVSVASPDALGSAGQRLHHADAADGYAGFVECVEEAEQKLIEDLFRERLSSGQAESRGKLFGDRQTNRVAMCFAAAVALVC